MERAEAGDETAIAGLRRVGGYLGIGIANLITLISPDRVVIGGGVAAAGDMLLDSIRAEIARRVTTTSLAEVRIELAELGTWAGAIGAAVHGAEAAERGERSSRDAGDVGRVESGEAAAPSRPGRRGRRCGLVTRRRWSAAGRYRRGPTGRRRDRDGYVPHHRRIERVLRERIRDCDPGTACRPMRSS